MIDKDLLKSFCDEKQITLKDLAIKAGLNYNGLHDKFRRKSLTVRDLEKLLDVLDKKIIFIDKSKPSANITKDPLPENIAVADLEQLTKSFNAEIVIADKTK